MASTERVHALCREVSDLRSKLQGSSHRETRLRSWLELINKEEDIDKIKQYSKMALAGMEVLYANDVS